MNQLVEARNVTFGYDSNNIFSGLDFEVSPGEILCFLGPNGCGKTTLLDCILGILKPRAGSIKLNGRNIKDLKPEIIARQVAFVPQHHVRTFPYTVMEVVLMGRAAYSGMFSTPSSDDKRIAGEALELLGLSGLSSRPYTKLSGGEGQLVMIARALAQKTSVIVMDEPTAHLDFKNELTIMETVVQLVRDNGLSVIMATHFPNHAFYFENNGVNTRVALLGGGAFLATGQPGQVLSENNLRTLYNVNTRVLSFYLEDNMEIKQVVPVSTDVTSNDERGRI